MRKGPFTIKKLRSGCYSITLHIGAEIAEFAERNFADGMYLDAEDYIYAILISAIDRERVAAGDFPPFTFAMLEEKDPMGEADGYGPAVIPRKH